MKQKPLSIVKGNQGRAAALSVGTLRVAAAVKEGETVTIGTTVFEVDTNGSVTTGNIAVDCSGSDATSATGTLTLTGNAVADETVVIGTRTYTFKTAAAAANQVKVGTNASESIDNLIAAINAATGAGTLYGTGTVAHELVTAAAGAGDTMVVTAKTKGTAGNAIGTTETLGEEAAWGGSTLSGGVDVDATNFTQQLTDAINNAGIGITAVRSSANAVVVFATKIDQIRSTATTETLTGTNNAWGAATLARNLAAEQATGVVISSRVPTATEVAVQTMAFPFSFEPTAIIVQIREESGVIKAWDGSVVLSDNLVTLNSSGTTDIAAADVVTVIAQ